MVTSQAYRQTSRIDDALLRGPDRALEPAAFATAVTKLAAGRLLQIDPNCPLIAAQHQGKHAAGVPASTLVTFGFGYVAIFMRWLFDELVIMENSTGRFAASSN